MSTGSCSWLRCPQRFLNTRTQNCRTKILLCPWRPTSFLDDSAHHGTKLSAAMAAEFTWIFAKPYFQTCFIFLALDGESLRKQRGHVQISHTRSLHLSQRFSESESLRVASSGVSQCWLFSYPAKLSLLEVTWNITVLTRLSCRDTRFDINIACLLNPFMEMSVWLSAVGRSSKFVIIDTSLGI